MRMIERLPAGSVRGRPESSPCRRVHCFLRASEKLLFEKLITVSGIGPKLAITILSGMPADEMVEPALPNLFFLAHNEIPPGLRVQSMGNIQ